MENKYTSGPWYVSGSASADGAIDYAIRAGGQIIAEAFGRSSQTHFHPSMANANLIAAAPEMLDALENLIIEIEAHEIHAPTRIAFAKSIVQKAKGEL